MSSSESLPAARADRLHELLDRWEDARERSIDLSAEVLCANDPDLLPIVREKIELLLRLEGHMSSAPRISEADPLLDDDPTLGVAWGCRLIRMLAEGGLGRVYLAKDLQIERLLAVKFLRPERRNDPEQLERFLVEAQITGALGHPGIVPILGIGRTHDDLPFYVMPLIEGRTMADAIDELHERHPGETFWTVREFRDLLLSFCTLCQTIAFAHRHRVLHRDIKPQNVILGAFGETILIDWGLATLLPRDSQAQTDNEKKLLATTLRVRRKISAKEGTLPYMSPELHLGLEELDPASDVYALGVTLFRLITGELPIQAQQRADLIRAIVSGETRDACEVRSGCPVALAKIAARAMSLAASERQGSVLELADSVLGWLDDHGTEVKPGGWWPWRAGKKGS